jgi:4-amino-4-deoxy-L-arabinose transferase-like glycosyltransferase/membrane-associated phospholipid phosphatase
MHWLQALDTQLFYFVNRSLSNPLFDWLMPILSGGNGAMRWFVPLVVVAALVALFRGGRKVKLCALMTILVVVLGDPLIVNVIKHGLARPRPCVALPEVVERLGCSGSGSMPSAHAANWFAATMVMFLFYRRSLRFMLPMALGVSFSRVYNGVHYPGDVLAGAILGAGYGAALVVGAQALWNFAGREWFPQWHAAMPSLVNSEIGDRRSEIGQTAMAPTPNSDLRTPISDPQWLHLSYLLIVLMLIARWVYIASGTIGLSQDEAYQWLWSKHLALSYYSKPLGIAVIQFLGTHICGDTELGVRFFSPVFAAILSVMAVRFIGREIGARPAFWLLLVVTATPLLAVGTVLMTIDPPLVLCWMWALVAGWRAVQPDGRTRDWLVVGLATGIGFLCKYTAAYQILCWAIFFALWPAARIHLRRPGPWLALLIFLLCTLPVVIWNGQHEWVTVQHVAGNAGLQSHWKPTLRFVQDFVLQELGLLNPVFLVAAVWAMVGAWRARREHPLRLFFFCMSVPVLAGHLLYSLHSRILPNWIAPAIPPMFCLMVAYWSERTDRRFTKPLLYTGVILGLLTLPILYQSNLIARVTGRLLPGEKDPLRRVRAYQQEAAMVENARERLETEGKPTFVLTGHYGIAGLYSFYLPNARAALKSEPLVYPVGGDGPRNQFYFWPEYSYQASRKGQNAIYVAEIDLYIIEKNWWWNWLRHRDVAYRTPPAVTVPARIASEFESVTDLGEQDVKLGDRVFHRIHLWACYGLK